MRYLVRSIKYFIYLVIILSLMIFILVKMNMVEGNLSTMFRNGYDSLWQIAVIMAVFALVYPRFGYTKRSVRMPGETAMIRLSVLETMEAKGYKLRSEDAEEGMVFIKRLPLDRLIRQFEDAVTFTRTVYGYDIEGRGKDIVRIAGSLESVEN